MVHVRLLGRSLKVNNLHRVPNFRVASADIPLQFWVSRARSGRNLFDRAPRLLTTRLDVQARSRDKVMMVPVELPCFLDLLVPWT